MKKICGNIIPISIIFGIAFTTTGAPSTKIEGSSSNSNSKSDSTKVAASIQSDKSTRPYDLEFDAEQHFGRRGNFNGYTQFLLDGNYFFGEKATYEHRLRIVQDARKLYEVGQYGESEFPIGDTVLRYYYKLTNDLYGAKVAARATLTVPLSEESRRHANITRPGVALAISRKFLDGTLTVAYIPSFTYHWYGNTSYAITSPLNQFTLAHQLDVLYYVLPKFHVRGVLTGAYNFKEKNVYASSRGPTEGFYEYEVYAGYDINENVTTRIGYNHSDSFTKMGRYEINVYDPAQSRVYIGLDLKL